MIDIKIEQYNLPDLFRFNNNDSVLSINDWQKRRQEITETLLREEYGILPPVPENVHIAKQEIEKNVFAGKGDRYKLVIAFNTDKGEFSFPVDVITPHTCNKTQTIIHIAFRPDIPDKYYPAEEMLDRGITVFNFCYQDITGDNNDFSNGIAAMYDRNQYTWGKIAMWAFCAMRVADIAYQFDFVDTDNLAVAGHSRLGKTALLTGALDERFKYVFSNNSGCSGAALSRNKKGERIANICSNFGYWFCDNYKQYINNEDAMPFDQHFLLSLICPRYIYVSSAEQDLWADPLNEFLTLTEVTKVYMLYQLEGLIHNDRLPVPGDVFMDGGAGYHLRTGSHYLSRYDWNRFIDFINLKKAGLS